MKPDALTTATSVFEMRRPTTKARSTTIPVAPITVNAGSATVDVSWDMRDDAGKSVGADDYSLVFNVVDDAGRTSTVGATLQVR